MALIEKNHVIKTTVLCCSLIVFFTVITSCQQLVVSAMEEQKKAELKADSIKAAQAQEYGEDEEDDIADEEYTVVERKKSGEDSLYLIRSYYQSSQKQSDIWYKGSLKHGLATVFYKNGDVFAKIIYKDDAPYTLLECYDKHKQPLDVGTLKNGTGTLKVYNLNTNGLIIFLNYKNGIKEGDFVTYYSTGEKKTEGYFKTGFLQGEYKSYFRNGNIHEQGFFENGQPQGNVMTYLIDGSIQKKEVWQNQQMLSNIEYNKKGQKETEEIRVDKAMVKIKYDYYPNGAVRSESRFINGYKNGTFAYYYEHKNIKTKEIWRNDTLISDMSWHDNGQLKSVATYKNNEREGLYKEYYSNGGIRLEQEYSRGKKNGKFLSYFKNGQLYSEGAYEEDEPKGKFKIYAEDGTYRGANTY